MPNDKVSGWNNKVQECKQFTFAQKTFLLVQCKPDDQFYVVERSQVSD